MACDKILPSDHGDLARKAELLEGRGEGLVDCALQRDSLDLHVLDGRDHWLALVDLDVVLKTLTLLIVHHVDGVFLASLFLADGCGLKCAEGCDGGRGAEAHAGASCGLESGAGEERHVEGLVCCDGLARCSVEEVVVGRVVEDEKIDEGGGWWKKLVADGACGRSLI